MREIAPDSISRTSAIGIGPPGKSISPVYVSPGHRVGIDGAVALTLRLVTRYRQPETTRAAHHLASVARDVPG